MDVDNITLARLREELTSRKGFNPVSYTHLRAHETVLDLVCRLLLEKKQPKIVDHTTCIDKIEHELSV